MENKAHVVSATTIFNYYYYFIEDKMEAVTERGSTLSMCEFILLFWHHAELEVISGSELQPCLTSCRTLSKSLNLPASEPLVSGTVVIKGLIESS